MVKKIRFTVKANRGYGRDLVLTSRHLKAERGACVGADTLQELLGAGVPQHYTVEWRLNPCGEFVLVDRPGNYDTRGRRKVNAPFWAKTYRLENGHPEGESMWAFICLFPAEWMGRTVSRRIVKVMHV